MSERVDASAAKSRKRRPPFPWLALLVFLGTVYLFWVLPWQLGPYSVKVEFSSDRGTKQP